MEGRTKRVFVNLLFIRIFTQFTGFSDGQTLTLEVPSAVEQGRDTVFTCTGGASPYIFRWDDLNVVPAQDIFTAGEVVYPDDQTKYLDFNVSENEDTSIMTISNTQIEDEGKYRCAEGLSEDFANFTVEVQSTRSLAVESTVENNIDMYIATCEVLGGRPDETISWMLGDNPAPCENPEPTPLPSDPGLFSKRSTCKLQATPANNGQTLKCVIGGHQVKELNGEETQVLNLHSAPGNDIVTLAFQFLDPILRVTCDIDAANQPTPAIRNYYIYVNDTLKHASTTGVNSVELTESEYDLSTKFECVAGNYLGNTTSGKTTDDPSTTSEKLTTSHSTTEYGEDFDDSKKKNKGDELNIQQELNDNVAYEMIQSGDRAYTELKPDSSHSFVIARENVKFFTRLGSIGRGNFGEVWKGDLRSKQNHLDVAIRQIPDRVTKSLQVLQTIKVLYNLSDQPNIVKCLGYCKEQGSILYEFISGGTLLTHLQTSGVHSQPTYSNLKPNGVRTDEGTLLNLAWQVAKGMQFLASEKKPTRWSSPETMVTGDKTTEGDIWSFGIVLWEIVTLGARPYPNMTFSSVQTEVAKGYQIPRPRHCAQEVYAVMTGCWEKEPRNRSNFDHILKSMERILEKTHSYLSLNDLDEGLYASTLDIM